MKQFLVTVAGVFVGLMIFFVGVPFLLIVSALGAPKPVAPRAVLELDLRQRISDQEPSNPFALFGRSTLSVMGIVETLHRAEHDGRVRALIVRLPDGGMAPAAADELRLAIKRFRASGKSVFAHTQGLYPSGAVTSTYMLGASADQLWMQPGASFQAVGFSNEDIFFKRFFDKHGVQPQYEQRYEYKNAVNPYLYDDYTAPHKQAQLAWMGSVYQTAISTAAADRKRDPAVMLQSIESGPHTAGEALAQGLVDRLGQVRDVQEAAVAKAGHGARLMEFDDYALASKRLDGNRGKPVVAVINAEGPILTGTGESAPVFGGEQSIYSDDVAQAFYTAIDDSSVKAIVFRLSSPGGVDTASEQILAAVRAAKAAGKPVVVSMGTYGASGGYWVSSEASGIVAEPTTLTGSIGVYGGKIALGPALSRFGVDMRQTNVGGDFAGAYATGAPMSASQRAAFAKSIDEVYDGFIQRVATGRRMKPERVREIAKGRVWTGAQARALGLVDRLGGFYEAVDMARQLAKIDGEVRLKKVAARASAFDSLQHAFGVSESSLRVLASLGWVLSDPRAAPVTDALVADRLRAQGANLLAPTPFH
jgi:protease-4